MRKKISNFKIQYLITNIKVNKKNKKKKECYVDLKEEGRDTVVKAKLF